jgi:hypothetical protein
LSRVYGVENVIENVLEKWHRKRLKNLEFFKRFPCRFYEVFFDVFYSKPSFLVPPQQAFLERTSKESLGNDVFYDIFSETLFKMFSMTFFMKIMLEKGFKSIFFIDFD